MSAVKADSERKLVFYSGLNAKSRPLGRLRFFARPIA
jgi:hypothetical protein